MDVEKVAPRQAVDQLAAVLDSPEVGRLINNILFIRWTGRPGYSPRAMIGMCLVKAMYAIPTWSRVARLVGEHAGLQGVLGCAPSQWACYRFAKMLRERDHYVLDRCVEDVIAALHEQYPDMGKAIAVDGSNLPAYANGHRAEGKRDPESANYSDPDASWGHRTAVSTRGGGGFYGYKIHAVVDVATDLPIAWQVGSAKEWEAHFALPLIDQTRKRGFDVQTAIMDKGYDSNHIHQWCMEWGIAPVIPVKDTEPVKRGAAEPPHCAHGEWTFAGADFKRKATKWRCPTGECKPASVWVKADRLHPLIPRESKRYRDLYRQRRAVEGAFGNLKTEWALLPLRVRGMERVKLHVDLTVLARLACRLASQRVVTLAA